MEGHNVVTSVVMMQGTSATGKNDFAEYISSEHSAILSVQIQIYSAKRRNSANSYSAECYAWQNKNIRRTHIFIEYQNKNSRQQKNTRQRSIFAECDTQRTFFSSIFFLLYSFFSFIFLSLYFSVYSLFYFHPFLYFIILF